jgi:hypothetical protein
LLLCQDVAVVWMVVVGLLEVPVDGLGDAAPEEAGTASPVVVTLGATPLVVGLADRAGAAG